MHSHTQVTEHRDIAEDDDTLKLNGLPAILSSIPRKFLNCTCKVCKADNSTANSMTGLLSLSKGECESNQCLDTVKPVIYNHRDLRPPFICDKM